MLYRLNQINEKELIPGFFGKMIHSEKMTTAYWDIEPDAILPEHSHPHEQILNLLEGEFELVIDGKQYQLKTNDVFVIPSNAVHSGKSLSKCRIIDVFVPAREDYQ